MNKLVLIPLVNRRWLIYQDFHVSTVATGPLVVPAGFICDLNSIPRFLWWASTPTDYPEAGTVHDYLYDQQVGQKLADDVYREVLLQSGMSIARARMRWLALRAVGRFAYASHAKKG